MWGPGDCKSHPKWGVTQLWSPASGRKWAQVATFLDFSREAGDLDF